MPGARIGTKVYMLFNHALFGQGIRSLLRGRRAIQSVGMARNEAKALEAIESLHPEVVILEQATRGIVPSSLGAILQQSGVGRVVVLNIDHHCATVYERRSLPITNSEDLVTAIQTGRGAGELPCPVQRGLPKRPRAGLAPATSLPRRPSLRRRAEP